MLNPPSLFFFLMVSVDFPQRPIHLQKSSERSRRRKSGSGRRKWSDLRDPRRWSLEISSWFFWKTWWFIEEKHMKNQKIVTVHGVCFSLYGIYISYIYHIIYIYTFNERFIAQLWRIVWRTYGLALHEIHSWRKLAMSGKGNLSTLNWWQGQLVNLAECILTEQFGNTKKQLPWIQF